MAPAMAAPVSTIAAPPPHNPSHKRSATSIFKSIVSPHKSSHKKIVSQSLGLANPLNTYMVANSRVPTQLPPLDSSTSLPPLDPPQAPFAQQARHKRSLSSLSIASFTSKKEVPRSPTRSTRDSLDIRGTMFDILLGDQNSVKSEKKPSKTRSTIDFSILRQKGHKGKKSMHDLKTLFRDKENQRPTPDTNPRSSASSGFVGEPNLTSGGPTSLPGLPLFTLPQNHPHTQGTRSGHSKTTTTRTTPQSSSNSLQRSLLPALPLAPVLRPAGSFAGSTSSSSIKRVNTESGVNTEELVRKYTPAEYTPSSQRNFFQQHEQPMLIPKPGPSGSSKQRPKSSYIPHSASGESTGFSVASPRRTSYELRQSWEKKRPEDTNDDSASKGSPAASEGSGKSGRSGGAGLDLAGIDIAFEALLVCNPHHSISLGVIPADLSCNRTPEVSQQTCATACGTLTSGLSRSSSEKKLRWRDLPRRAPIPPFLVLESLERDPKLRTT